MPLCKRHLSSDLPGHLSKVNSHANFSFAFCSRKSVSRVNPYLHDSQICYLFQLMRNTRAHFLQMQNAHAPCIPSYLRYYHKCTCCGIISWSVILSNTRFRSIKTFPYANLGREVCTFASQANWVVACAMCAFLICIYRRYNQHIDTPDASGFKHCPISRPMSLFVFLIGSFIE